MTRLVMLGESDRSVHDILRDRHDDDDRPERDEVAEWLQGYLVDRSGEAPAVDVYRAGNSVGYSRDQLKRAKRRAGVATRKTDMRGGWVWALGPEPLAGSPEGSTEESEEHRHTESAPFAPLVLPS
jgi:hypothetical protein